MWGLIKGSLLHLLHIFTCHFYSLSCLSNENSSIHFLPPWFFCKDNFFARNFVSYMFYKLDAYLDGCAYFHRYAYAHEFNMWQRQGCEKRFEILLCSHLLWLLAFYRCIRACVQLHPSTGPVMRITSTIVDLWWGPSFCMQVVVEM